MDWLLNPYGRKLPGPELLGRGAGWSTALREAVRRDPANQMWNVNAIAMPHIGDSLTGWRCVACGVRMDNSTRGQKCPNR